MTDNRFKAMYDLSAQLGGSDEEPKMTLRDKFAMAAMQGIISTGYRGPMIISARSYEVADAMLEARKTTGEAKL
jgi:hypothetical protein